MKKIWSFTNLSKEESKILFNMRFSKSYRKFTPKTELILIWALCRIAILVNQTTDKDLKQLISKIQLN